MTLPPDPAETVQQTHKETCDMTDAELALAIRDAVNVFNKLAGYAHQRDIFVNLATESTYMFGYAVPLALVSVCSISKEIKEEL